MIRRTAFVTLVLLLVAAIPVDAQRRSRAPTPKKAPSGDLLILQKHAETLESRVVALERQVAKLLNRVEAVESNSSDASTDMIGFTEAGSSVVLEWGGSQLEIGSGGLKFEGNAVHIEALGEVHLKATGSAKVESQGMLDLKGSAVRFNGGSKGIAKEGSLITGNSPSGGVSGQVSTGSPTVMVP